MPLENNVSISAVAAAAATLVFIYGILEYDIFSLYALTCTFVSLG